MRLEQKVAITTSDGTDIGEAIAKIAIAGRWKDESERVHRDMERKGGQALALPGGVREDVVYESS